MRTPAMNALNVECLYAWYVPYPYNPMRAMMINVNKNEKILLVNIRLNVPDIVSSPGSLITQFSQCIDLKSLCQIRRFCRNACRARQEKALRSQACRADKHTEFQS